MRGKYKNYYTTPYFEEYARIALNDLLNLSLIRREDRYGQDKPDLISDDEMIGVEVTLALSEEAGRHNKLFQRQYPKENRNEILKEEAKRLRIEKDLHIVNGIATLKMDGGREYYINTLSHAVNKKLKNLNKPDFNKYPTNILYIGAYHHFAEDIEEFLDDFTKYVNPQATNFDLIYILNVDGLYIFNGKDYQIIPIPEINFNIYKQQAIQYVKDHEDM